MRINPINSYNNTSFGRLKTTTKGLTKEIFQGKEEALDYISEAKELDVWAFTNNQGGIYNQKKGYLLLIQDQKTGNVLKEIKGKEEERTEIVKRVEDSLVWHMPLQNISIAQGIKNTNIPMNNPKDVNAISTNMLQAAMSNEVVNWEHRFKII